MMLWYMLKKLILNYFSSTDIEVFKMIEDCEHYQATATLDVGASPTAGETITISDGMHPDISVY